MNIQSDTLFECILPGLICEFIDPFFENNRLKLKIKISFDSISLCEYFFVPMLLTSLNV